MALLRSLHAELGGVARGAATVPDLAGLVREFVADRGSLRPAGRYLLSLTTRHLLAHFGWRRGA